MICVRLKGYIIADAGQDLLRAVALGVRGLERVQQ